MKKKNGKILDKVIKLLNTKKAQQPVEILQNFQVLFHAKFNVFFQKYTKKILFEQQILLHHLSKN